ncbi:M23 family metallopeptidase [Actinophytocola sp.]|uniref:M23 family metallopeptidase n=1 Tax=Actinophytocola sp. TaxID=1872138 RepID=UPI003D6A012D
MTGPPRPRPSVLVLALVTGLATIASPALLGVASAPVAPPVTPAVSGVPTVPTGSAVPGVLARSTAGEVDPRAGPPTPPAGVRFGWPLAPPHPVVRPFDAPSTPYGPGHRGVDLGGTAGEAVLAAGAGVVVFAGQLAGRGVVSVDHPNGLRTTYEPLTSAVKAGRRVAAGAVLGHLRPGHARCPGACMHWGVRRGEAYLDPLTLVATGHVRLLPWEEGS